MNKGLFLGLIAIPLSLLSCQKGEPDSSVDHILVERVTLNKTELTLIEGDSEKLEATVFPENAENRTVSWSSSNAKVVMVTDGEVVAIVPGSATITARAGNRQAQCQVTVQAFQYQAVDLGLSVKWGNANVGASKPEEFGEYYAWAEKETKETFSWSNYKWADKYPKLTKYTANVGKNSSYGEPDGRSSIEWRDDAASAKLGPHWRIPTINEIVELISKCSWKWTKRNGIDGYEVKGESGNSIFIPAGGYKDSRGLNTRQSRYWSSIINNGSRPLEAFDMSFTSQAHQYGSSDRINGLLVRPVFNE